VVEAIPARPRPADAAQAARLSQTMVNFR
jgi:hypothetical protein